MRFLLLVLLIIINSFMSRIYTQQSEKKDNLKKIKILETKILVIEDYIKNKINEIYDNLKEKDKEIKKLKKSNKLLKEKIKKLTLKINLLENKILKMQTLLSPFKEENKVINKKIKKIKITNKNISFNKKYESIKDKKVKKWLDMFYSSNISLKIGAIVNIAKLKSKDAIKILKLALQDKNKYIVIIALKSLVTKINKNNKYDILSSFIYLLNHRELEVRKFTYEILKKYIKNEYIKKYKPNLSSKKREKIISFLKVYINNLKKQK